MRTVDNTRYILIDSGPYRLPVAGIRIQLCHHLRERIPLVAGNHYRGFDRSVQIRPA